MAALTDAIEEVKALLDTKKKTLLPLDYEALLIEVEETCDLRWRELNPAGGKFIDNMIANGECVPRATKR